MRFLKSTGVRMIKVPFERCYEESGMIEIKKGWFTQGYEIIAPMKPKEMTYSVKKVRAGMGYCRDVDFSGTA